MPKKMIINGFSLYMKDLQRQLNSQGNQYSLADMPAIASPQWEALPNKDKIRYNERAKKMKNQPIGATGRVHQVEKLTSDGIPISHIIAAENKEKDRLRFMLNEVKELLTTYEDITELPIYITNFNILCTTQDGLYLPNEIAMVKYTLKDGIVDVYHQFIDPGCIPVGYTGDAKAHSETTHKIPITGFESWSDDYRMIFEKIVRFMKGGKAIIFSRADQLEQSQNCFEWLKLQSGYRGPEDFYFADLVLLVIEIKNLIDKPLPAKFTADDILLQNGFDYSANSRCTFHEDLDNPYCSLGFCRKMCYIISDTLCADFDIELSPNHIPQVVNQYQSIVWQPSHPLLPVRNSLEVKEKPQVPHKFTTIVTNTRSTTYDYEYEPVKLFSNTTRPTSQPMISKCPMAPQNNEDNFPSLGGVGIGRAKSVLVNPGMKKPTTATNLVGLGRGIGRGQWKKNQN